jgi:hypothetical protein
VWTHQPAPPQEEAEVNYSPLHKKPELDGCVGWSAWFLLASLGHGFLFDNENKWLWNSHGAVRPTTGLIGLVTEKRNGHFWKNVNVLDDAD